MDKPVEFRTAMRGYNKEDVNSYISNENIRFNRLEASLNKAIDDKEKEISELQSQIAGFRAKDDEIKRLEDLVLSLRSDIDYQNEKLEEKDTVIEGMKKAVDAANEALDTANERITALQNESELNSFSNETPHNSSLDYSYQAAYDQTVIEKAQKYDDICTQIEEILLYAKNEADKIVSEAIEIRQSIQNKRAKKETSNFKNEIQEKSDSIISELKKSIFRQLKGIGK